MKKGDLEKLDFQGWPLPDEYLKELGRVSVLWVSLEAALDFIIGGLLGFKGRNDPRPFIILAHANFRQKLDILGSLCEQYPTPTRNPENVKDTIGKLRAAQKARNTLLHNAISVDQDGQIKLGSGSARGKITLSVRPITVADIREESLKIYEAMCRLYKLAFNLDLGTLEEFLADFKKEATQSKQTS